MKWGQRCVNTASVFTRHHVTVASAYSCSINVLLWLILSHSHTHLPLNTPPAVSPRYIFSHAQKNYERVDWALLKCFVRLSPKLLLHSKPHPEHGRPIVIIQNLLWLNAIFVWKCKKISTNAQENTQQMWHTCFEAGLVDFNLSSYWLRVLQVGKVVEGFRAGGSTGEAVGHGLSGTVRPPTLDLIVHSHQLEDTNTQRLKLHPEYSKILNIVCRRSKMNELSSR